MTDLRKKIQDYAFNALLVGVIRGLLLIPYKFRIPLMGAFTAHIVSPLAGYKKRIIDNLNVIFPDMPKAEIKRICTGVPDNAGRTLMEIYSGDRFLQDIKKTTLSGAGLAALDEAHQNRRPIILITGHFGNYDALRAAIFQRGHKVGGLYRPMANPYFNAHYVKAIEKIGKPAFPRGRRGLAGMVQHLKRGNTIFLLIDQRFDDGAPLDFFGHTASTALSAAEMALKYDALLIAGYGIRKPDGLGFDIVVEAPIKPSTAEKMTQELNDSLENRVRDNMDQWLWIHRRWDFSAD